MSILFQRHTPRATRNCITDRPRILIADDHPVVRAGVYSLLAGQPDFEIVCGASNGAEVITLVSQLQSDAVLMDLRMPEMDNPEATKHIKA